MGWWELIALMLREPRTHRVPTNKNQRIPIKPRPCALCIPSQRSTMPVSVSSDMTESKQMDLHDSHLTNETRQINLSPHSNIKETKVTIGIKKSGSASPNKEKNDKNEKNKKKNDKKQKNKKKKKNVVNDDCDVEMSEAHVNKKRSIHEMRVDVKEERPKKRVRLAISRTNGVLNLTTE